MKKLILFSLLILMPVFCFAQDSSKKIKDDSKILEKNIKMDPWVFKFDERAWEIGYQQIGEEQKVIVEYVLKGESVENWSELVTSYQAIAREGLTIDDYLVGFKSELSRDCPSLEWNIIKKDANNAIFEWKHQGCQGFPPEDNIIRICKVKSKLYSLGYAIKTKKLNDEKRTNWLSSIENAILLEST